MADPLSIAASKVDLISLVDIAFILIKKYIRSAKNADKDVRTGGPSTWWCSAQPVQAGPGRGYGRNQGPTYRQSTGFKTHFSNFNGEGIDECLVYLTACLKPLCQAAFQRQVMEHVVPNPPILLYKLSVEF